MYHENSQCKGRNRCQWESEETMAKTQAMEHAFTGAEIMQEVQVGDVPTHRFREEHHKLCHWVGSEKGKHNFHFRLNSAATTS